MKKTNRTLKIALIQEAPCDNEAQSILVGTNYCYKAKSLQAEIVLFPEMWNVGYSFPSSDDQISEWMKKAITEDSDFIRTFCQLAKTLQMVIAISYLEKTDALPKNTVAIINKQGRIVHTYSKVHLCEFGAEKLCMAGKDFPVTEIETSCGKVKIGTLICFDREFPEAARILMLQGAEIILIPNACELEQNRKSQLLSRAYENMVGIALANYCQKIGNGHSIAYSGIAFRFNDKKNLAGSLDQTIIEAPQSAGIFIAEFPLQELRAYRKSEVWGNAYRKPETYSLLISSQVREPFIRYDRKGTML